jgi:hypothetical protein
MRTIFADRDAMSTQAILDNLIALEESPWGDLRGKPLNSHGLSRRLHSYGISPKLVRLGDWVGRGYSREDLHDAWGRYLGPSPIENVTPVTPVTDEPHWEH